MKKLFWIALLPITILAASYSLLPAGGNTYVIKKSKDFIVFDGTLYKNKPKDLEKTPFPKIHILYANVFWNKKEPKDKPNIEKIRKVARSLEYSKYPYIIDIEHWNAHSNNEREAETAIDKYITVIKTLKEERPDLKFGYYGVLPNRDYWAPITRSLSRLKKWEKTNARLERLAKYVDAVFPSLYTFYDDIGSWEKYAIENIKRARKYGKPVYPFLWPQYHPSNKKLKYMFIPQKFWKIQLETCRKYANGIIIWGGWDFSKTNYGRMTWNSRENWWHVTYLFIHRKN